MGKKILALITIILLWAPPVRADSLRVFFLDVGEGDKETQVIYRWYAELYRDGDIAFESNGKSVERSRPK